MFLLPHHLASSSSACLMLAFRLVLQTLPATVTCALGKMFGCSSCAFHQQLATSYVALCM